MIIFVFFNSLKQIKETNFSLCIVFPKYAVNRILRDLPPSHTAFLYHRWDIASWPGEKCKQFARYATSGIPSCIHSVHCVFQWYMFKKTNSQDI